MRVPRNLELGLNHGDVHVLQRVNRRHCHDWSARGFVLVWL